MPDAAISWQLQPMVSLPDDFLTAVQQCAPAEMSDYLAQLLWQRGIREVDRLAGFLDPARYTPASPLAFGTEMERAVDRLQRAYQQQEMVGIWGDFDADGVTATAVLWDGLGQFFRPQKTLIYYIPNRFTESHGLSRQGLDRLCVQGCRLVVTCDTGSTNLDEIEYARTLGMDVIVTDHHTLPRDRPPVAAIVNPRNLPSEHPLANLSGVAVAYKLVEALYETLPQVPTKPLTELLDLVAIGLIADLVELKGDCRYLAQQGIAQLQKQSNPTTATRPGIAKLLELCKRSGDRPTDISFGLGPRINAVSRIQGDAHFCIELLTSQDRPLCNHLAEATELANSRRKELQKAVMQQVSDRLKQLDLSTTEVIVLADEQWQAGVLGLVAGQIAQDYHRPTILLSIEGDVARGSARSVHNIDLYQLVHDQAHLLQRFGGHPYAAGLSLAVENLAYFTEAVNQQLRQTASQVPAPSLAIDLVVTVAELGKSLFQTLKQLEPCGMGNPAPKLLIQNCWFETPWNQKIKDWKGRQVQYIKTEFGLRDDSTTEPFPGIWWGHYRDELPSRRCDAVVELDFNAYQKRYHVRLIAVRPSELGALQSRLSPTDWLLDWRDKLDQPDPAERDRLTSSDSLLIIPHCPSSWTEFFVWFRRANQAQQLLAIAYPPPLLQSPTDTWQQLVGIAKYLSRTGQSATRSQILNKLEIGDRALQLGFRTLKQMGFQIRAVNQTFQISGHPVEISGWEIVDEFLTAVKEEAFRRQYFYQVPLGTIRAMAAYHLSDSPGIAAETTAIDGMIAAQEAVIGQNEDLQDQDLQDQDLQDQDLQDGETR